MQSASTDRAANYGPVLTAATAAVALALVVRLAVWATGGASASTERTLDVILFALLAVSFVPWGVRLARQDRAVQAGIAVIAAIAWLIYTVLLATG